MATVFRAHDPNLDRFVAVKVLPSYYTDDPTFVDRFTQEAQTVAKLRHANILQIFDFGEDKGFTYIVSELVAGGTLQDKPVIILTTKGRHSGKVRKTPLMRVEDGGAYAVIASMGGAPKHPVWYLNMTASPEVTLQDGANVYEMAAHDASGEERERWWAIAVEAWPGYAEYQTKTDRQIPVVILKPAG